MARKAKRSEYAYVLELLNADGDWMFSIDAPVFRRVQAAQKLARDWAIKGSTYRVAQFRRVKQREGK